MSAGPLELVRNVMLKRESLSPTAFLRDLAEAFQADGAGLSDADHVIRQRLNGIEPALPWVDDAGVRTSAAVSPIIHVRGSQHFLCGPAGRGRVCWIEKTADSLPWAEPEQTAFGLVGPALAWRLEEAANAQGGAQQRLDDAVQVARKLAHVYSNVLTSVLGFLEMGLTQTSGNAVLKRYLEIALRGTEQGVTLTQRLRLLGCRATLAATGVALLPLLSRQTGKRAIPGKVIEEVLDIPNDLPLVFLTTEQGSALLDALLDNAHEAIDRKGRIVVTGRLVTVAPSDLTGFWGRVSPGLHVQLDVADTGSGIGPDAHARLFKEPFFSAKPRHHGLGLTIAHSILSSQQGGLSLLDQPGGGTVARILLPVVGERRT